GLRDLGGHVVDNLLDQVVFDLLVSLLGIVIGNTLADRILESVEGVILADIHREIVVESGQLLVLDLMKLDLEGGVLAGQFGSLILLRELDIDIKLLTGAVADDLLLKARDKGAAAKHEVVVLGLAALKCNAIDKAFEIDIDSIAVFGCTLTGQHTAVAVLHTLEFGFNLGLVHSLDLFGHVYTGVIAQRDFGLDRHLDLDGRAVSLVHRDNFRLKIG